MDFLKQLKVDNFRTWLQMKNIKFAERPNGQFIIYDEHGKLAHNVWATTEKMIDHTQAEYVNGMDQIREVLELQLAQLETVPPSPEVKEPISDCRQHFLDVYKSNKGHLFDCILVVAVHQPNGATSIITDSYEVESKMEYYIEAYDDSFKLKRDPHVQVVGFMLV